LPGAGVWKPGVCEGKLGLIAREFLESDLVLVSTCFDRVVDRDFDDTRM
jgi:hypothetical protein